MSRLMSVAFTEDAVRERRKTVTRRKGWWTDKRGRQIIKPGDRITLCRKVMGRKKGEPLERIVDVEIVSVRREPLFRVLLKEAPQGHRPPTKDYGRAEMAREGFPGMDPLAFVDRFFRDAQGIKTTDDVTRIEWRYLDDEPTP